MSALTISEILAVFVQQFRLYQVPAPLKIS